MRAPEGRTHPAYLLYRLGRAVAARIPERVLFPLAEAVGWVVGRLNVRRRAVVRRNMRRVVAQRDLEPTVDRAFRSYARYWMETLRIPSPGPEAVAARTTHEGLENLEKGRGVVIVSAHVGSWDVAGLWLASLGWRIVAIAERIEPPALFDLFARLRLRAGVEVHPLGLGSSARALISGLREGAAVGLVADRDISRSGVEVTFLGEATSLPTGPAILAMRTGAPLVAAAVYQRPGGRYHAVVREPIWVERRKADPGSVRELTQRVASELEHLIRADPGQWHMFQPNWPSDPGYLRGST